MRSLALGLSILLLCSACGSKSKESLYEEGVKQLAAANPASAVVYFKNALEKDGNFVEARFQLAKAFAALGKTEQAEKEFTKVLSQNPSRDEVTLELARLACDSGKGEQALKLAERYLAGHPGSLEGLEARGISCAVLKRYDEAESSLRQALQQDPRRAQTKLELASLLRIAGKIDQAKTLLNEVVASDPGNVKALYLLGDLEKKQGNASRAAQLYQAVLAAKPADTVAQYKLGLIEIESGALEKAEKRADAVLKSAPNNGDGLRLKGLVHFQRGNYREAAASLQASLKSRPTVDGYYFLGLCYYNQGELESALSQFRVILDRIPEARQARLMTGQTLIAQNRVEDAIAEIRKVLATDDSDAAAHNLLASAYLAQGMFEEGMRELNRATALDPKLVSAHLKKGYLYLSRGKNTQGESELASAVQAAPGALTGRLLLASYYQRQGKREMALSTLKAGLTGGKGDAPLYNALAVLQFSSGERDQGMSSIARAKQVDPAFPASYQNLAAYYAASGDYPKASAEYGAFLRVSPRHAGALLGLAAICELSGKDAEALAQYKKATETRAPEAFLALAGYHRKKGEIDQALAVLDEAAKLAPRAVAPLETKGRLLAEAKRYREALKVFQDLEAVSQDHAVSLQVETYLAMQEGGKAAEQARRLIAKYPTSARGHLTLAAVHQRQNDLDAALSDVQNGIRVDGKNELARLALGNVYLVRKDYGKAMAAYQDALRLKPDFVAALFAEGVLLDQTGKKREAVAKYRAVLARSDSYLPALNNLAFLLANGYGNKEEALRLALEAFKRDPGNAAITDTVGYALLKNGRTVESLKVLEKAAALLPNDPSVRYHLALAYKESGDPSKAQQALQKALSLGEGPDTQAARALLAQLKR